MSPLMGHYMSITCCPAGNYLLTHQHYFDFVKNKKTVTSNLISKIMLIFAENKTKWLVLIE